MTVLVLSASHYCIQTYLQLCYNLSIKDSPLVSICFKI